VCSVGRYRKGAGPASSEKKKEKKKKKKKKREKQWSRTESWGGSERKGRGDPRPRQYESLGDGSGVVLRWFQGSLCGVGFGYIFFWDVGRLFGGVKSVWGESCASGGSYYWPQVVWFFEGVFCQPMAVAVYTSGNVRGTVLPGLPPKLQTRELNVGRGPRGLSVVLRAKKKQSTLLSECGNGSLGVSKV